MSAALQRLPGRFEQMQSPDGRASAAPEKLLEALFSGRSERRLTEQFGSGHAPHQGHRRKIAIAMVKDASDNGRITVGSGKGYTAQNSVGEMRRLGAMPCAL